MRELLAHRLSRKSEHGVMGLGTSFPPYQDQRKTEGLTQRQLR